MAFDLRPVTEPEHRAFQVAVETVFGMVHSSPEVLAEEATVIDFDRTVAAFDGDRIVGTAADIPFAMTLPGGGTLPVAGVTSVGVAPTHRRRGLLRAMMTHQLDAVAARGEPLAVLNASEAAIYGRFGYGLASLYQSWRLDTVRCGFREPVVDLPLRLVAQEHARADLAAVYDRWRPTRPGALSHSEAWWGCVLSSQRDWRGGGPIFVVVCDPDPDGSPAHRGGYAIYTVDNDHPAGRWQLEVRDLVAADDVVLARLWRYLLDVDLVSTVVAPAVPLDDPLRWRLVDPRQVATTDVRDYLHVRILDVEAALAARRHAMADELVLEVSDAFRPATAGRYRVQGGPGGATCARTDDAPDLVLDIAEVGSLLLGGVSVAELAQVGRIRASSPAVVARADAFFRWPVAPFCVTRF